MADLIREQIKELIGKKIIVFFRYETISYNIKKSGILIASDNNFFVLDEVKDGRSVYAYDFVVQVMEDRS